MVDGRGGGKAVDGRGGGEMGVRGREGKGRGWGSDGRKEGRWYLGELWGRKKGGERRASEKERIKEAKRRRMREKREEGEVTARCG